MLTICLSAIFVIAVIAIVSISIARAQSRHWFLCRNCGKEFQLPWTQLVFEVHACDEHRLKCPFCQKKDFCTDQGKRH